eukprot:symbB.v1.2.010934.t1/scaffold722.1/size169129/11
MAGPLMYNYACQADAVQRCRAMLPGVEHTAAAPTSTLCKAWEFILHNKAFIKDSRLVHQADWLLGQLLDQTSPGQVALQMSQSHATRREEPSHRKGGSTCLACCCNGTSTCGGDAACFATA